MKSTYNMQLIFILVLALSQSLAKKFESENRVENSLVNLLKSEISNSYLIKKEIPSYLEDIVVSFPLFFRIHSGVTSEFLVLEASKRKKHLPILRPAIRLYNEDESSQALTNVMFAKTAIEMAIKYESDQKMRWFIENTRLFFVFSKVGNNQEVDCNNRSSTKVSQKLPVELDRLDRIKKSSLDIAVRGGGLGSTISNPNLDENTLGIHQILEQNLTREFWLSYSYPQEDAGKVTNLVQNSEEQFQMKDRTKINFQVSQCLVPFPKHLDGIWANIKEPLMKVFQRVHDGVKGQVLDENENPVRHAKLKVRGTDIIFSPDKNNGEFYQILPSGRYMVDVTAKHFRSLEVSFSVDNQIDITILSLVLIHDYPLTASNKPDNRKDDEKLEERTPVYVPKIPKNVYETILNGLNLLNLLTPLKMALG